MLIKPTPIQTIIIDIKNAEKKYGSDFTVLIATIKLLYKIIITPIDIMENIIYTIDLIIFLTNRFIGFFS